MQSIFQIHLDLVRSFNLQTQYILFIIQYFRVIWINKHYDGVCTLTLNDIKSQTPFSLYFSSGIVQLGGNNNQEYP